MDAKYKHRIGEKNLTLVGIDGNPLVSAEVTVRQKKHEFLFGGAEFSSVAWVNNELDGVMREKVQERLQIFLNLFNYTTLPFYWVDFEPVKGQPNTERLRKAAHWFKSNGCIVKGHPLCWHSFTAPWLHEMSNPEVLSVQLDRIKREVSDFKGSIDVWDVINEAVIMRVFNKEDNGITRICKEMGRIKTIREMFLAAKEANPDAMLLINDFVYITADSYHILIEGCLEAGIPIDAIGIQSHMHQGYWGVEKTQEILELFSCFNLPIHFTESTMLSGHTMPKEFIDFNDYDIPEWNSTPEGEERQAREAVLHYKTLFENPKVESITWWELTDGQWLGAPTGLLDANNRKKPAFEELNKLIKGEWWTKPIHTITDENGSVKVSGFRGEYEAVCNGKKKNFELGRGEKEERLLLK